MAQSYIRNLISFYEEKQMRKEQRKLVRDLAHVWDLPRSEFIAINKVSPELVLYLCQELEADLAPRNSNGLPVYIKVLTALRLLTSGHYQRGNGQDQNTSVGQTTVSKYLTQFLDAVILRLKPKWLVFPGSHVYRQSVAAGFQRKFGLPNILGAIDCTQITLFPPPGLSKVQYLNRHGDTSINVQLVVDADCNILNCNANYPGQVHDQFIFNNSVIKNELKELYDNRIGEYYLLGDSGYALEPWMMTPIRGAQFNTPEKRYTEWHCRARNCVERTNGYLKGTFRMLGLDRNIHYMPDKASQIIYASCTIYNILKHYRHPMETVEDVLSDQQESSPQTSARLYQVALSRRNTIVQTYFSN